MTPAGWLAELAPAEPPPAAGWWPPAPGWWLLAALLALAMALGIGVLRDPARRRRRAALRELRTIRAALREPVSVARALEDLLRRYALAQFGRERIARLSGRRWCEFTALVSDGRMPEDLGSALLESAFGGIAPADPEAVRERWLRGAEAFVRGRDREPR